MKDSHLRLLASILCLLVWTTTALSQEKVPAIDLARNSPEQVIRATYEKLILYHRAAELFKKESCDRASRISTDDRCAEPYYGHPSMSFELSNFHTGPLEEIADTPTERINTKATGQVISISPMTIKVNEGAPEAAFEADWRNAEDESGRYLKFTVRELFSLLAKDYFDVATYTSYDVVVHLAGKSRKYRAIVFFHDQSETATHPWPEFWDGVSGDGVLTQVWRQSLPPYQPKQWPAKLLASPTKTAPESGAVSPR